MSKLINYNNNFITTRDLNSKVKGRSIKNGTALLYHQVNNYSAVNCLTADAGAAALIPEIT